MGMSSLSRHDFHSRGSAVLGFFISLAACRFISVSPYAHSLTQCSNYQSSEFLVSGVGKLPFPPCVEYSHCGAMDASVMLIDSC